MKMSKFRISVSLKRFFNNQRSLYYIFIDDRFQTIGDLEHHIKRVFKLDCDICLIINDHVLLSTENVNLIHESDSIHVLPVNEDFCLTTNTKINHEKGPTVPIKRKQMNENNSVVNDDSSEEIHVLKTELESVSHSPKKKKTKKSVPFTEIYDTKEIDTNLNEAINTEAEIISEEKDIIDNKHIQILNIENVSNMELDTINSDLGSKNTETKFIFSNMKCSHTKLCNIESKISSYDNNEPNNSELCNNELNNFKLQINEKISETNCIIKEDTTNINHENKNDIKNEQFSDRFIEHLRPSYNSKSRGKIPPFTVGEFLNYIQEVGQKEKDNCDNSQDSQSLYSHVTTRRRRIRKRKSQNKEESGSSNSISDVECKFKQSIKTKSPLIHIRFDNEDKNEKKIVSNGTKTSSIYLTSTPIQNTVEPNSKEEQNTTFIVSDSNCFNKGTIIENNINIPNKFNNSVETLTDLNENYFINFDLTNLENVKNTVLNKDISPKINDIIAFKLYELNEKYEPHISNWIIGKIINSYQKMIDVFILAGHVKANIPKGKFDIDDDEISIENDRTSSEKYSNIVKLNIMRLIDPRLLLIKH